MFSEKNSMSKKSGTFFDMQFITSCISTMLVLLLLGMVAFFVMTANNLSVYVRENIACSVVLSDDMKESEILVFQKKIEKEPFVRQTTYISKTQALKEQTEAMGTDPAEFLGYNPFTASIEIKLNSEYANTDSLRWIQEELMEDTFEGSLPAFLAAFSRSKKLKPDEVDQLQKLIDTFQEE